jgi:lipopolysaccharide export system protein LptA
MNLLPRPLLKRRASARSAFVLPLRACARSALGLVLLLQCAHLAALRSDRNQAVDVEADRSEASMTAGRTTLSGNVRISQGSLDIRAERAEIVQAEGEVKQVTLTGAPARLQQELDDGGGLMQAEAQFIDYKMGDELVRLRGGVKITQPRGEMSSETIQYNIKTGQLIGGSEAGTPGRVKLRLAPPPKPATPATKPAGG